MCLNLTSMEEDIQPMNVGFGERERVEGSV